MAKDDPKFIVRMPPDLKGRIEQAAKDAGRSMNAEIVHRLEQTFAGLAGSEQLELIASRAAEEGASRLLGALIPVLQNQAVPPDELAKTLRALAIPKSEKDWHAEVRKQAYETEERNTRRRAEAMKVDAEDLERVIDGLRDYLTEGRRSRMPFEVQQRLKDLDAAIESFAMAAPVENAASPSVVGGNFSPAGPTDAKPSILTREEEGAPPPRRRRHVTVVSAPPYSPRPRKKP